MKFFFTNHFSYLNRSDGGGLRMKISAIPPNTIRANNNNNSVKKESTAVGPTTAAATKTQQKKTKKKHRTDLSSSSCCSACTESDSDSSSVGSKSNLLKKSAKLRPPIKRPKPVNISGGSGQEDESDVETGNHLTQSSVAKTKKSNLTKTASETNKSASVKAATDQLVEDGGSSSDMELPALVNAVNAAIQRVESSDSESTKNETSKSQYTSSLLHDFMVKTQMLGTSATEANNLKETIENAPKIGEQIGKIDKDSKAEESSTINAPAKRKRGRPKKLSNNTVDKGPTSESPDSGIISTPHSPANTAEENKIPPAKIKEKPMRRKSINKKVEQNVTTITSAAPKLNIASLEKSMYATERVLYPPRHKRRNVSATNTVKSAAEDLLDPVWRKIDINKKFRRPSVSGYKSDGGSSTICSKILAAQSNYVTDYGAITQRCLSGYKSDYSCKSKRSGYKSDFSVKAKSCGYRSDCSSKFRKKIRRKRRTKFAHSKSTVNETDILQLAGLSLGQSEESSRDSVNRSSTNLSRKNAKTSKSVLGAQSLLHRSRSMTTGKEILNNLCERVTKRLSGLDNPPSLKSSSLTSVSLSDIYKRSLGSTFPKVGMIRSRRPSAVSHCSSRSGCSRQHFRRRRRKRLKSQSRTNVPKINLTKLNMQIEMLTNSFSSLCRIATEKPTREKNDSAKLSSASKRMIKKRKQSELIDSAPSTATTTTKRRHKKQTQTQSPDDHKLPLKKRQYLMTSGEKHPDGSNEPKSKEDDTQSKSTSNSKCAPAKAVTPKKRHLLETPFVQNTATAAAAAASAAAQSQSDLLSIVSDTNSSQESLIEPLPESLQLKYQQMAKKNDILTRKKNRLEGLVSKIMPNLHSSADFTSSSSSSSSSFSSLSKQSAATSVRPLSNVKNTPPPGVFEPSIDLELQIPATTIPAIVAKTEIDSPRTLNETLAKLIKDEPNSKTEKVVETLLNKTGGHLLLKKKRKKQNRTGFPTIRKKKKKSTDTDTPSTDTKPLDLDAEMYTAAATTTTTKVLNPAAVIAARMESQIVDDCDRVPKTGEAAATFIERNSRPRLSVVSLEKLQGKPLQPESNEDKPNTDAGKQKQKSKANVEPNKRCRDSSAETTKLVKKYKSDANGKDVIPSKTATKKLAASVSSRDVSSDNEPLINFVNKSSKLNTEVSSTALKKTIKPKAEVVPASSKKSNKKESINKRNTKCSTKIETADAEKSKTQEISLSEISISKEASKIDNHSIQKKPTEQPKFAVKPPSTSKTGTKTKRTAPNEEKPTATLEEIERKSKLAVVKIKLMSNIETLVQNPTKNGSTSEVNNEIADSEKTNEPLAIENDSEKKVKKIPGRRKTTNPKVEQPVVKSPDPLGKTSIELEVKTVKPAAKPTTTKIKSTTKEQSEFSVENNSLPPATKQSKSNNAEIIIKPFEEIDDPCEHDPLPIAEGPSEFPTEITSDSSTSTEPSSKKSLKLRKKYLSAGLFSDSFKDSMCKSAEKSSMARNYIPEEYPEGLLPPPLYCEKFFRRSIIDFQIPFDLWTAHENDKLPGRNSVPSWNFRKIRTNVYNDVRAVLSADQQSCSCKPDSGCGDDCLNRLMYTECSVKTCPCADKCQNTKIQRHIIAPGVERFMTENKGWGVKTKLPIKKGTYISEYVGEIVTEKEFKERMATLYIRDTHHYCLNLDGGLVIDGHRMGSDCRFVNHSCSPNCEMQKWSVNGLFRMALFAMRNIEPGEELTYDYNFSLFNPTEGQPCRCDTPQCRGVIGGKSQRVKPIDIQVHKFKTH